MEGALLGLKGLLLTPCSSSSSLVTCSAGGRAGSSGWNSSSSSSSSSVVHRMELQQEETALEAMIVDLILSGKWQILEPNSGKAVTIGKHHVCVSYGEDKSYRTWEWHGHIMVHDHEQQGGCTPEYVYGNFLEELEDDQELDRAAAACLFLKPNLGFCGISV